MTCPKCGSERTDTFHTDRYIRVTCKDCKQVSEERYATHQRKGKSEAERGAEEIVG